MKIKRGKSQRFAKLATQQHLTNQGQQSSLPDMDRRHSSGHKRYSRENDTYDPDEIMRARNALIADTKFGRMYSLKKTLRMDDCYSNVWEGEEGMMEHRIAPFPMPELLEDKPPVVVVDDSDDEETKGNQKEENSKITNGQIEPEQTDVQIIEPEVSASTSSNAESVMDQLEAKPSATPITSDGAGDSLCGSKRPSDEDNELLVFKKKKTENVVLKDDWPKKVFEISLKLEDITASLQNYVSIELKTKPISRVKNGVKKIKANILSLHCEFTHLDREAREKQLYGKGNAPFIITKANKLFDTAFISLKRELKLVKEEKFGSQLDKSGSGSLLDEGDSGYNKSDKNMPSFVPLTAKQKEENYWKDFDIIFNRLKCLGNDIKQFIKLKRDGKWSQTIKQQKQVDLIKEEIEYLRTKLDTKKIYCKENGFPKKRVLSKTKKTYVKHAFQVHQLFANLENDFQAFVGNVNKS